MKGYVSDEANATLVIERQILKGKGILDLCLERGKNLCMKGFIDSQLERGEEYIPVVKEMVSYIDRELELASTVERKTLLLDLHDYADEQLRSAQAVWQGPPGEM